MHRFFCIAIIMILSASGAGAGGYQLNLHGHKNAGMGLAGTALTLDASSAFYNPGAMGMLPSQIHFSGGISGIRSITKFQLQQPSVYQAATDNSVGLPFYLYAVVPVSEKITAGLAINTPFGSSIAWEDGWAGRFLVQEIALQTLNVQPAVSYKIAPTLSAGIGLSVMYGKTALLRKLPVQGEQGEGEARITGSTLGAGFNAGILWSATETLDLGLSYRSAIQMKLDDASAEFNVPQSITASFPSPNMVSTSLPLPASLDFGLAYNISPQWLLALNLNYVFWSVYKELNFDFETNTTTVADQRNPRNYSDKMIIRGGLQYEISDSYTLRAGAYFDPSPADLQYFSPETPTLDSWGLTAGLSVVPIEKLSIDLSFVFVMGRQTEASYLPGNFNGIYKSRAWIPGIGVSYHL